MSLYFYISLFRVRLNRLTEPGAVLGPPPFNLALDPLGKHSDASMATLAAQPAPSLGRHPELSPVLSFFSTPRHEMDPPCPSPDVRVERRAAADVPLALLHLLIPCSWSLLLVSGR